MQEEFLIAGGAGGLGTELAIVGDFDPAEIQRLAGELFGTWKSPAHFADVTRTYKKLTPVNKTFETPFELIAAQGRAAQAISYTTDEHRASVEQFLKPKG